VLIEGPLATTQDQSPRVAIDAEAAEGSWFESLLGAGGMGDVYKGRDVALKLLPRAFATDRDRLARFQRKARAARVPSTTVVILRGLRGEIG
jgi:hypothetical protein